MSCSECEKYQEKMDKISYYRVGVANVMVVGCPKHLKELYEKLNKE